MAAVDAISVVEQCYDLHGDRASWLTRVTEAVRPLIDHGLGAQGVALRWPQDGALELLEGAFLGPEPTREFTYRTYHGLGPEGRDAFFRWTPILDIARETMRKNGVDIPAWESQSPDGYRFRDLVVLCARDGTDQGVGLSA